MIFPIFLAFVITFGILSHKAIEAFVEVRKGKASLGVGNTQEFEALRAEVAALKQQLSSLHETTTQYDISFDAALQRMERRVERVESERKQIQRVGM